MTPEKERQSLVDRHYLKRREYLQVRGNAYSAAQKEQGVLKELDTLEAQIREMDREHVLCPSCKRTFLAAASRGLSLSFWDKVRFFFSQYGYCKAPE